MKKIFYFILPAAAFVLILFNMLFGHLLFESPYGQDINKYSVYVHLQPEWKSYPYNIFYDVTNVWSNPNPKSEGVFYDSSEPNALQSDYNSNQLQYQNNKSFVKLQHEFSNCETSWKPPPYRYAIDTIRNDIGFAQGTQLTHDPYVSKFPNVPNQNYDLKKQEDLLKGGYAQFIPVCTAKNSTSYDFAVSVDDKKVGLDVFFVPSETQLDNYLSDDNFEYYDKEGCFAQNYNSFSGSCDDVGSKSGLLIVIPDALSKSLTKVNISLHEKVTS
jgi:hypothetical protein